MTDTAVGFNEQRVEHMIDLGATIGRFKEEFAVQHSMLNQACALGSDLTVEFSGHTPADSQTPTQLGVVGGAFLVVDVDANPSRLARLAQWRLTCLHVTSSSGLTQGVYSGDISLCDMSCT